MPRAGFELATPATKRPQTYTLDRAATGIDSVHGTSTKFHKVVTTGSKAIKGDTETDGRTDEQSEQ
jgi:hypothetical protein